MDQEFNSEGEDTQITHNQYMLERFRAQSNQNIPTLQQPFWNPVFPSTPMSPALTNLGNDDSNFRLYIVHLSRNFFTLIFLTLLKYC